MVPVYIALRTSLAIGLLFGSVLLLFNLLTTILFARETTRMHAIRHALLRPAMTRYGAPATGAQAERNDDEEDDEVPLEFSLHMLANFSPAMYILCLLHLLLNNVNTVLGSFATSLFVEDYVRFFLRRRI